MRNFILKAFDATFWKFLLAGVANTLFGSLVMFVFYNIFHFSYWVSSASNYLFGGILSYFLSKNYTFKNNNASRLSPFLFIINISLCYLIAYGLARPLVDLAAFGLDIRLKDNISMLAGMCLFVLLNYLGQRFVVFKN